MYAEGGELVGDDDLVQSLMNSADELQDELEAYDKMHGLSSSIWATIDPAGPAHGTASDAKLIEVSASKGWKDTDAEIAIEGETGHYAGRIKEESEESMDSSGITVKEESDTEDQATGTEQQFGQSADPRSSEVKKPQMLDLKAERKMKSGAQADVTSEDSSEKVKTGSSSSTFVTARSHFDDSKEQSEVFEDASEYGTNKEVASAAAEHPASIVQTTKPAETDSSSKQSAKAGIPAGAPKEESAKPKYAGSTSPSEERSARLMKKFGSMTLGSMPTQTGATIEKPETSRSPLKASEEQRASTERASSTQGGPPRLNISLPGSTTAPVSLQVTYNGRVYRATIDEQLPEPARAEEDHAAQEAAMGMSTDPMFEDYDGLRHLKILPSWLVWELAEGAGTRPSSSPAVAAGPSDLNTSAAALQPSRSVGGLQRSAYAAPLQGRAGNKPRAARGKVAYRLPEWLEEGKGRK